MNQTKIFKTAPLPFQGQKRRFLNLFKTNLSEFQAVFKSDITIVDLFGGSGLLSHTAKKHYPNARVIYNDYDNYSQRLAHVDKTNTILNDIRFLLKDYPDAKRINDLDAQAVFARIEQEKGFVDYITLSSSLLFSMKYVLSLDEFRKQGLYNNLKQSNYDVCGYLDDLEVVHMDYKDLFDIYKDDPNVLFLVDPPYLSTDCSTYISEQYWKLADYLNVINVLKGTNYIYFTSNKSSIVELCEWIETNLKADNPFRGATLHAMDVTMNHTAKYRDMMLCRFGKCA